MEKFRFIKEVNSKKIQVIVFNFERIHSAKFPWNLEHQNSLLMFDNLCQFVADVNDAEILGKNILNKQYLSKDIKFEFENKKRPRLLFLGQVNPYYPNREQILQQCLNLGLPLDIELIRNRISYVDFLNTLSTYRFILNPLGTGEFINVRFYEALAVGSIPIQQITKKMSTWYSELDQGLIFEDPITILALINNEIRVKVRDYYLEDYFQEINLQGLI